MNTKIFNENYTIDRQAKGLKATAKAKDAESALLEMPLTADGTAYSPNQIYYFFDETARAVRDTTALRRDKEWLCGFGLKIIAINKLHARQSDALAEGRDFVMNKINNLMAESNDFDDRLQACIREEKKNDGN